MKEPYFIDVPAREYHADAASGRYLSSHNLAQFRACPYTYSLLMTGKMKRPESPALAFGRAVHCYTLEGHDAWMRDFLVSDGPINERTGQAYGRTSQKWQDFIAKQSKEVVSCKEFEMIEQMAQSVWNHPDAKQLLEHGEAVAVLAAAGVRRLLSSAPDEPSPIDTPVAVPTATPVATNAPPHVEPPPPPPPPLPPGAERNRPRVAQNLLLKLEKAEAAKDVELAVATIEQLRALPGEAVADLDNSLARRLGELNIRRLFVGKNRQWVKEVVVRRGDSATRIASENGSTLASLLKLNELPSADRLRIGQKLDVMDHPRFTIVVHRAAKYADLTLKGKFFKRYDIIAPVRAEEGNYETPARLRAFLAEKGIALAPADSAELDMLVPAKSSLLVSEL